MGGGTALWGGFSSFFSIWQLCILQFSPFFLVFIVGIYFSTPDRETDRRVLYWTIPPCIAFTLSFTLLYSLLIASGLNLSRPLVNNLGGLRMLSGFLILLASLYIFLNTRLSSLGRFHRPAPLSVLSLIIGVTFALMYSPCITPMLSDIMGLASQRSTALEGWYLAFFYGLGTSIATCAVSVVLIGLLGRRSMVMRNARRIADACGVVLLALAIMNIFGLMTYYKAFLLGLAL